MEPRGKRRIAAKASNLLECTDERCLREVAREIIVTGEPKGQPINAIDVYLVELTFGGSIASNHPRDQFDIVHRAPRLVSSQLHCRTSDTRCRERVEEFSIRGFESDWPRPAPQITAAAYPTSQAIGTVGAAA